MRCVPQHVVLSAQRKAESHLTGGAPQRLWPRREPRMEPRAPPHRPPRTKVCLNSTSHWPLWGAGQGSRGVHTGSFPRKSSCGAPCPPPQTPSGPRVDSSSCPHPGHRLRGRGGFSPLSRQPPRPPRWTPSVLLPPALPTPAAPDTPRPAGVGNGPRSRPPARTVLTAVPRPVDP